MELFLDVLKRQKGRKPLGAAVATDMQLEEICGYFLSEKEKIAAVLGILNEFCADAAVVEYRKEITGDLIYNDSVFRMFTSLRENLKELQFLYEMKMFKAVPEAATMKTFLITEKFAEMYMKLYDDASAINKSSVSPAVAGLISEIAAGKHYDEICLMNEEIVKLRKELETIGEIRLNRFFSRGQNIENSIIAKTDRKSLMAELAENAEALGADVSDVNEHALHLSRELSRPVFNAFYKLYYGTFRKIDEFHEKYKDFFDNNWFTLITDLDAVLGFAVIFRKLSAAGFPVCAAEIGSVTTVNNFYSLLLVMRSVKPADVVFNDYNYTDDRRFYIITGANAGGKTIYLSSVGICQLFFQACGFVPAKKAHVKLMNRMFTHFPVEEYNDNSGRLVEEQGRVDSIFKDIENDCMVLFNETYSSTKADIAYELSVKLLDKVLDTGLSGLFVTHLHSLRDYAEETKNPDRTYGVLTALSDEATGKRLYRIVPLSGQDSSYARDILKKYAMTIEQMIERINLTNGGDR